MSASSCIQVWPVADPNFRGSRVRHGRCMNPQTLATCGCGGVQVRSVRTPRPARNRQLPKSDSAHMSAHSDTPHSGVFITSGFGARRRSLCVGPHQLARPNIRYRVAGGSLQRNSAGREVRGRGATATHVVAAYPSPHNSGTAPRAPDRTAEPPDRRGAPAAAGGRNTDPTRTSARSAVPPWVPQK